MKVESLRRLSRASNSPENCLTLVWALQSTPQCTAFFEERSPTDAESVGFETCSRTGSATGVATEEAPEVEVEGVGHSQIAQTSESNLQLAAFSQPCLLQPVPTLLQKEQSVFRGLCQALLCGHACSDVRDLSVSKKS